MKCGLRGSNTSLPIRRRTVRGGTEQMRQEQTALRVLRACQERLRSVIRV